MEVHQISGKEIHIPSARIRVTLLSRLGCFQIFSDQLHLLFCFMQNFQPENQPFTGFGPVERGAALSSVQYFERGHLETGLVAVVV